MLRDRLRTAALLITVLVILIGADALAPIQGVYGIWLLPLLLFFSLGTAWDFCNLLIRDGKDLSRRATMIATGLVTCSAAIPMIWPLTGSPYPANCPVGRLGWIVVVFSVCVCGLLLDEMRRYGKGPPGSVGRMGLSVLIVAYVGIPMALLVSLRLLGSHFDGGGSWGLAALGTMIAVTKSCDTGAYFTGRAIGRNKLIPRLSPGKTWEGAFGGIALSTLTAWLCLTFLMPAGGLGKITGQSPSIAALATPWIGALVLGPVLAIAGMLGDLAESMVKRECDAKDSGNLLPGMGGVWDVTDSLIAASLPAFLLFASGVAG